MPSEPRYWFPAKRYGWGWGLPVTWEGWAVLVVFACLLFAGFVTVPQQSVLGFVAYMVVLGALLTAVCWWKGEPPGWRWGDE